MANRQVWPVCSNIQRMINVHCRVVFEADAEADGETLYNHHGFIASITRDGEGTYTIKFTDIWKGFAGLQWTRIKDGDVNIVTVSEDVNNSTAGSGNVVIAFQTAGSDADPDGETVELNFLMHNTNIGWNAD